MSTNSGRATHSKRRGNVMQRSRTREIGPAGKIELLFRYLSSPRRWLNHVADGVLVDQENAILWPLADVVVEPARGLEYV
jgi:hypothetical protein